MKKKSLLMMVLSSLLLPLVLFQVIIAPLHLLLLLLFRDLLPLLNHLQKILHVSLLLQKTGLILYFLHILLLLVLMVVLADGELVSLLLLVFGAKKGEKYVEEEDYD
jgi:hypothetical protein